MEKKELKRENLIKKKRNMVEKNQKNNFILLNKFVDDYIIH